MHILKRLTWILFPLWLVGCASVQIPPSKSVTTPVMTWGNRVGVLSNLQDWDLDALIAVRNNAKREGGSANMQWRQSKNNYDILLFGPLGSNSVKLTGSGSKVSLETADGKKTSAATPEQLLTEQTGWRLPVTHLYYWIRGLPVPGMPAQKSFDSANRLQQLVQQGWTVRFINYRPVNQIDMPSKIFIDDSSVNVKIIIKQWQI